ncbi:MAG TPA: right-handed parallel beta-helix repeat-containing protein, partial [Candidatus Cryosericum sp.]
MGNGMNSNGHSHLERISKPYIFSALCLCLTVLCETTAAATYYTSPSGTGDGSTAQSPRAWNNATWVSPGDTVYLLDGSYGSWSTSKSGSAGSVITFAAVNQYGPKFTWVGVSHSYLSISGIDVNHPPANPPTYGETAMRLHGGSASALLTNITVSGCKIHGPTVGTGPCTADLQLKWVRNVLIEDCEVYNGGPYNWESGSSAIQLDECEYVTVRGCHIYNFLCGGIRTGSGHNYTFEYNRIHDQRYDLLPGIHGSGISIHSQATTIRGNVVYDCGNTNSIRFYQQWAGDDGYHDMLVENNVFFETGTARIPYNPPMFIDLGANCVFRNNTFQKGVQMYLAKNATGSGLSIYNNLFMGGFGLDNYGALATQTAEQAFSRWRNVSEGGNIFRNLHAAGNGFQVNRTSFSETSTSLVLTSGASWAVGTMFASATGEYPYQLAEGSPAIGLANPNHAPSTDLLGRARSVSTPDAGCYEYGMTSRGSSLALTSIGNQNVAVGATLTLHITSTGSESNSLEYSATPLPSGAKFSEQTFTWAPTASDVGTHQVTFTVSDGSAQDSETITITVSRPNAAPILGGIGNKSVNENQTL